LVTHLLLRRPIGDDETEIRQHSDLILASLVEPAIRTIRIDTSDLYTFVPQIETYKAEIATHARRALEEERAQAGSPSSTQTWQSAWTVDSEAARSASSSLVPPKSARELFNEDAQRRHERERALDLVRTDVRRRVHRARHAAHFQVFFAALGVVS
jgi:hypothetical protein